MNNMPNIVLIGKCDVSVTLEVSCFSKVDCARHVIAFQRFGSRYQKRAPEMSQLEKDKELAIRASSIQWLQEDQSRSEKSTCYLIW